MIYYIAIYYFIGLLVSMYFIYYYRLSNKTKSKPSKNDAWLALIGPWIFPIQIIKHINIKRCNESEENLNSDSRSFTYDELKKAFEDGKKYGDGELPLINDFDFTGKPDLTTFDVWFDDWVKKN